MLAPVGGMVVAQKVRETWTAKVIVFEGAPPRDGASDTSGGDANHRRESKKEDADGEAMEAPGRFGGEACA